MLIKLELINHLRNIKVIGWTTLIFGLLLFWGDRFSTVNKLDNDLNFKSILFIGFMQVLALIPGTSRSGISLTSARFLKFNRVDSAKISFLLSIPTLGAVSVFGIGSLIIDKNFDFSFLNLTAIILSFTFSFVTIKFFLEFLKKFSLKTFVVYRLFLGTLILILAYL